MFAKTMFHFDFEVLPESRDYLNMRAFLTWDKGPLMVKLKEVGSR